ncbi:hypothetical protein [Niabella soli]|uniref:TonB-dependent receptor plug domain-containing protein n=1 Tax=Niabella soli DSM 19437 TaxID=929713 RepID=W0F248_9BACT|nr:hypothetical protein [Niabella soli]AHF17077.1 hypothetical protein NIASO_01350 [Niabella soli DSM 19437]
MSKQKFKSPVLFMALLNIATLAQSQDITAKIEKFATRLPVERTYLHYDKSSYSPGETIWFKAYALSEIAPAEASKNLYVDWIDDKGKLLQHTISPLVTGMTNGQFELPATYSGRSITVKAYTSWMLNFDSSFLYNKKIPVINPGAAGKAAPPAPPSLTFFPEGGDAIAGISNKIAFKAVNAFGDPVKISGTVVDESGKFVDSLRNMHDGMGFLLIKPKANGKYTAKWKDDKKTEYTTPLPAIKSEGVAMHVTVLPDKRTFEIITSPGSAANGDSLHIVGTMYQHVVFNFSRPVQGAPITGSIPLQNLPYGVLTITVFDKGWKPLAERITYVNNNSYILNAAMDVEHWGLSHRARNELVLSLPEATPSSLSVAVTDLAIGADSSENILSSLMLTGELKGKVYNPAYYFKDSSLKVQQQLDLVMLTNGWRRFNWNKLIAGDIPQIKYPRDTSYITVSGKLAGIMPSQITPLSTIVVMMKPKDGAEGKVLMMPINKDGRFSDASSILFDTARVFYKIQDKSLDGSMVQFMSDRLRTPPPGNYWASPFKADTAGNAYHMKMAAAANAILEKNRYKELETVVVKAKTKSPTELLDEKYASGLFKGDMNARELDVMNDPFAKSAIDVFTYLQGKFAGLQVSGSGSNASLSWRGGAPQIYIDEMPADVSFASSLNMNDVAYIKAFPPPFMGGAGGGANGAVAIYTRKGGDIKQEPGKGLDASRIEGYTSIKEFYMPKYYSQFTAPDADKDLRTTIYWNPNVTIDPKKKQITLSFYNNDVTDAFHVVIEGMTVDGKLIHHEENME